jgi:hypothetical protein
MVVSGGETSWIAARWTLTPALGMELPSAPAQSQPGIATSETIAKQNTNLHGIAGLTRLGYCAMQGRQPE